MMNYLKLLLILLVYFPVSLDAAEKEVRGAWFAWAGSDIPSRENIIMTMEQLAAANFNVVYVDVWRFGYPYFRSEVFYNHTGLYTDPSLNPGRDVLQEVITEGHRVGLEVDAWFEAGFSACTGSNDDLYTAHPGWFAKKQDGSVIFTSNGGIEYKWLSHCNQNAQQFLIDLTQEVVEKYDIDGIEFDRVRYPELNCGYDSATIELYQSENGGQDPPTNYNDAGWIRWRADKLTEFVATLYDSIKALNQNVMMSNAPLPWGYEQFCQDYPPWIDNGYLDHMATQMYYTSDDVYTWRLDLEMQKIDPTSLLYLYPGISTVANSDVTPAAELIKMIETTRSRGLEGNVIWYTRNLLEFDEEYLAALSADVYKEKVDLPYREETWRPAALIINETDSTVEKSGNWYSSAAEGFENGIFINDDGEKANLDYYIHVPFAAWFDVFVYNVTGPLASKQATYVLYSQSDSSEIIVDQTNTYNAGWFRLGSAFINAGEQYIVKLSNRNATAGERLTADAVMMQINRKLSPDVIVTSSRNRAGYRQSIGVADDFSLRIYPNPFNHQTVFKIDLTNPSAIRIKIYNMLGQKIEELSENKLVAGERSIFWSAGEISSGIYFYLIEAGSVIKTGKVVLLK